MEQLFNIFNLVYDGITFVLLKSLIYLIISLLVIFIIFFIVSRLNFWHTEGQIDYSLKLKFMVSLIIYLLVVDILFGVVLHKVGFDNIDWESYYSYLGLGPIFVLYVSGIVWYLIRSFQFRKLINQ